MTAQLIRAVHPYHDSLQVPEATLPDRESPARWAFPPIPELLGEQSARQPKMKRSSISGRCAQTLSCDFLRKKIIS